MGFRCRKFYKRISIVLHSTLGSSLADAVVDWWSSQSILGGGTPPLPRHIKAGEARPAQRTKFERAEIRAMAGTSVNAALFWFSAGVASGCCVACLLRKRSTRSLASGADHNNEARPPSSDTPTRPHTTVDGSPLRAYALRVPPGAELKTALQAFVKERGLRAAAVVTCVGSLTAATLRLANADRQSGVDEDVVTRTERFEILSLVGTLSATHGCHLHVSLGDKDGSVFGGHCVGGMEVFTTAEVVLAECKGMDFERHFDERTGFKELCVLCGPVDS